MPNVDLHYGAAAALLVERLIGSGARRFLLMIATRRRQTNRVFAATYAQMARAAGMEPRIQEIAEGLGEAGGDVAIRAEIAERPDLDGVPAPMDALATGVMAG